MAPKNKKISRKGGRSSVTRNNSKPHKMDNIKKMNIAPVSHSTQIRVKAPIIKAQNNRVIIKKSEYVTSEPLTTTNQWQITNAIPINPGLPTSFPWLSGVAANFEKYRFRYLQIRYVSRSPTNTISGVLAGMDYDSNDHPPVSEQQLSTYNGAIEFSYWDDAVMELSSKMYNRELFVRTALPLGNYDIKNYDVGVFYSSSLGAPSVSSSQMGKWWVDYEIELINPQSLITNVYPPSYISETDVAVTNELFPKNIWLSSLNPYYIVKPQNPYLSLSLAANTSAPGAKDVLVTIARPQGDTSLRYFEVVVTCVTYGDFSSIQANYTTIVLSLNDVSAFTKFNSNGLVYWTGATGGDGCTARAVYATSGGTLKFTPTIRLNKNSSSIYYQTLVTVAVNDYQGDLRNDVTQP